MTEFILVALIKKTHHVSYCSELLLWTFVIESCKASKYCKLKIKKDELD